MTKRRRRREPRTGRIIITLGLILKVIQIIGTALSFSPLGSTPVTVAAACLLVGGFAVLAIERLSVTTAFCIAAAVGIIGTILPNNSSTYALIYLMITFFAYAAVLISYGKKGRASAGAVVAALSITVLLHSLSVFALSAPVTVILLVLIYSISAIGLYL